MSDRLPQILVAAAALFDRSGRVLLAQRPPGVHLSGLWEFPGGKVEPGESLSNALKRELKEELGVDVGSHRPLIRVGHAYDDRKVILDVHAVTDWSGDIRGREGQALAWANPDQLHEYPMPAADVPIVRAIRLPAEYAITPPEPGSRRELLSGLERLLARGVRLVQLRLKSDELIADKNLVAECADICRGAGAEILVNSDIALAQSIGCGVHLIGAQLRSLEKRPLSSVQWVGASCHSESELQLAESLGMDFVVLSPVKFTASHADVSPLGWSEFARLVETVNLPVFALGGMSIGDIPDAWQSGGQGIAAIGGLWAPG